MQTDFEFRVTLDSEERLDLQTVRATLRDVESLLKAIENALTGQPSRAQWRWGQELCQVCAVAYPRVLEAARLAGGGPGPMVVSLEPHSIADMFATIRLVAELAGVEERGTRWSPC